MITISQLQSDFFSYIEESTKKIENINARLEHQEIYEIDRIVCKINQLEKRISEIERFVTGSKPDFYPVIIRDIIEDKD